MPLILGIDLDRVIESSLCSAGFLCYILGPRALCLIGFSLIGIEPDFRARGSVPWIQIGRKGSLLVITASLVSGIQPINHHPGIIILQNIQSLRCIFKLYAPAYY